MFKSLDPVTGRPDVDPERKPGTNKRAEFCPNAHGGKNWPPIAFSPRTRMIYIPANDNVCGAIQGAPEVTYTAGKNYTGTVGGGPQVQPHSTAYFGQVQAWNVDTGKKVWEHNFTKSPNWGSMLATGGDLVISGGTNDRKVRAFDAKSGKVLWEYPTGSGVEAPVSTFLLDGKQYIAVVSGWGGDANGYEQHHRPLGGWRADGARRRLCICVRAEVSALQNNRAVYDDPGLSGGLLRPSFLQKLSISGLCGCRYRNQLGDRRYELWPRQRKRQSGTAACGDPAVGELPTCDAGTVDETRRRRLADDTRRTYDGWGYSPLNADHRRPTSRELKPVWTSRTGAARGHEAPPIVNNGVMFVPTPNNQVLALNARHGTVLWRYRNTALAEAHQCCTTTQSGRRAVRRQRYFAAGEADAGRFDAHR